MNVDGVNMELKKLEFQFKQTIEPYRSDLWKYCFTLTRSPWDAEDLVQETLLKAFSMLTKVYQPIQPKAYLMKIATNLWIDQWRREQKRSQYDHEHVLNGATEEQGFTVLENLEILMTHLSPKQYVALVLSDVFDCKAKEVAELIGTSENAVTTNVHRARQKLRKQSDWTEVVLPPTRRVEPNSRLFQLLLDGFKSKDPKIIASVLNENVVTDIIHSGYEMGKDETENQSLQDWAEIVRNHHEVKAEYVELWGRYVLIEYDKKKDNQLYLTNIHTFNDNDGEITLWRFYCFSWDFMQLAAKELEVELGAAYFYNRH
ncbi:RNA polymerase sigma-70 factor (ECF subfamily) [Alkalihalobacillus xiaoxiensis]|uniref:RNA polymerase sigma factor n=1 Tax=Shouchella xiaoxiensis TaxID=766895 RepID=A0ABS2STN9_9BACI|nr:RNA polymerase sigma factor [Shouchella xiaoxiensis]MBM7838877.1 RNA polymerase sigma-70 factor (ECF subfamily) [Shouchella xiaoxiensis]